MFRTSINKTRPGLSRFIAAASCLALGLAEAPLPAQGLANGPLEPAALVRADRASAGLTAAAAAAPAFLPRTVGDLHNEGIRYMLERMDRNPPRAEIAARIIVLAEDYCQRKLHLPRGQCTVFLPDEPIDPAQFVQGMGGSKAFRNSLLLVVKAVDTAPTLRELEKGLAEAERSACGKVTRVEANHLVEAISIARSSGRLWAPLEQGGLGGMTIDVTNVSGTAFKLNWKKLVGADFIGCLTALLAGGCLGGALVGTGIEAVNEIFMEAEPAALARPGRKSDHPQMS